MSPIIRTIAVIVVGAVTWCMAGWWCVNPAERFYVAVPLVALTIYVSGIVNIRQAVQTRLRPGLSIAVGLFLLGVCIASLFFGPTVLVTGRFWIEVGASLYFLTAVVIVLLTLRRLLLAGTRYLHERWKFSPGVRMVLCEALPLALFVLFALPYAMAFSHVHRFKLPNLTDPKRDLGRDYENVEFTSADGTLLRGWWLPAAKPSTRTLVLCHGIAANRTVVLPFIEVGDWLNANVFMFDLRGHGDSGGRTVTLGCREKDDILAAIAYLRRDRPGQSRQVIGMGISLGAASMAQAAAAVVPPLDGVILDGCFTSTYEMTHSVLGAFPPVWHDWLMTFGLPMADLHAGCAMMAVSPEASIDRLRAPVVFLHSRGDPLIPSDHAVRLYQRAAEPKQLCIFELDGHCDGFFAAPDEYREAIREFEAMLGPVK